MIFFIGFKRSCFALGIEKSLVVLEISELVTQLSRMPIGVFRFHHPEILDSFPPWRDVEFTIQNIVIRNVFISNDYVLPPYMNFRTFYRL